MAKLNCLTAADSRMRLFLGFLFPRQAHMLVNPEEMLGVEHTGLKKPRRTTCTCEYVVDAS